MRFLLFIILILSTSSLVSQEKPSSPDVIQLKDGSIIKGSIIDDTDYHIRMVISTGDTLTIGYKYIHTQGDASALYPARLRQFPDGPYFYIIQGSGNFLIEPNYDVSAAWGKRISKRWQAGLEMSYLNLESIEHTLYHREGFLGFGVYSRYIISTGAPRLFTDMSLGYGMGVTRSYIFDDDPGFSEDYSGSVIYAKPAVGWHFAADGSWSFLLKIGVRISYLDGEYSYGGDRSFPVTTVYDKWSLAPMLSVGFEF